MRLPEEDLRVRRTREFIRKAFMELLDEMEYDQISVKDLAARANINRKTFYLHYPSLDDLLYELQDQLAAEFVGNTNEYSHIREMDSVTREFFEHSEQYDRLHQKLLQSGPQNARAMHSVMERNRRFIDSMGPMDEATHNVIRAFLTAGSTAIYRQWVEDGRSIPLEEIIRLATDLVCTGVWGLADKMQAQAAGKQ